MLGRIKHKHGELKKNGPLEDDGEFLVDLRRKGDQDGSPLQIPLVAFPIRAILVALLGAGPFREGKSGNEHEQQREEKGPEDGGVEGFVGLALDETISCGGHGDHVDGCVAGLFGRLMLVKAFFVSLILDVCGRARCE